MLITKLLICFVYTFCNLRQGFFNKIFYVHNYTLFYMLN